MQALHFLNSVGIIGSAASTQLDIAVRFRDQTPIHAASNCRINTLAFLCP